MNGISQLWKEDFNQFLICNFCRFYKRKELVLRESVGTRFWGVGKICVVLKLYLGTTNFLCITIHLL